MSEQSPDVRRKAATVLRPPTQSNIPAVSAVRGRIFREQVATTLPDRIATEGLTNAIGSLFLGAKPAGERGISWEILSAEITRDLRARGFVAGSEMTWPGDQPGEAPVSLSALTVMHIGNFAAEGGPSNVKARVQALCDPATVAYTSQWQQPAQARDLGTVGVGWD